MSFKMYPVEIYRNEDGEVIIDQPDYGDANPIYLSVSQAEAVAAELIRIVREAQDNG